MLRRSILSLVPVTLAAVLVAASPAHADPPTRTTMITVLSGFERGPDLATVQGWGAGSVPTLIAIARDTTITGPARLRALYALRAFPAEASAHAYLQNVALDTSNVLVMRRAACDALAEGFGDVATLSRLLTEQDPAVRDGVAWSLSHVRTAAARTALENALRRETSDTVRATLRTVLQAAH